METPKIEVERASAHVMKTEDVVLPNGGIGTKVTKSAAAVEMMGASPMLQVKDAIEVEGPKETPSAPNDLKLGDEVPMTPEMVHKLIQEYEHSGFTAVLPTAPRGNFNRLKNALGSLRKIKPGSPKKAKADADAEKVDGEEMTPVIEINADTTAVLPDAVNAVMAGAEPEEVVAEPEIKADEPAPRLSRAKRIKRWFGKRARGVRKALFACVPIRQD